MRKREREGKMNEKNGMQIQKRYIERARERDKQ